jgi:hypothetical protein
MLYNEGWILRLVLDAFDRHRLPRHPLSPLESARWFSEPLLPSAFLPRARRDPLGESWTHADGVVGHFNIGLGGRADLSLAKRATQFIVTEAKMFSRLSSGVSHARYYDQAARNVGCIAEVLARAGRDPADLSGLGFYLIAPQKQFDEGAFHVESGKSGGLARSPKRSPELTTINARSRRGVVRTEGYLL